MKKILNFLLLILCLTACDSSINSADTQEDQFLNVSFLSEQEAKNLIENQGYIPRDLWEDIRFEDSFLLEEQFSETYFMTVHENFTGNFQGTEGIHYYWVEDFAEIETMISQSKPLSLLAVLDGCYQQLEIMVSTLPLLHIQSEEIPWIKDGIYLKGTVSIYESHHKETKAYEESTYFMEYKVRGQSSTMYDKKSFKFQLLHEHGSRQSASLLGLRKDDDWNLIPVYTDYSLIREATMLSLYEQLSQFSDSSQIYPQHMEFCELFINNKYWGCYELVEPMDGRQVELTEERDFLYQSTGWALPRSEELYQLDVFSVNDTSIEIKSYPTSHSEQAFEPLADYMSAYYESQVTLDELSQVIHLENFIDHSIFSLLFALEDNDIKNMYYVAREYENGSYLIEKNYVDFDISLGNRWQMNVNGGLAPREIHQKDSHLSKVLLDYPNYVKFYVERYEILRNSIFTESQILEIVDQQYAQLNKSGTIIRNHSVWGIEADMEEEYQRLKNFVIEHLVYTDEFVDNLEKKWLDS